MFFKKKKEKIDLSNKEVLDDILDNNFDKYIIAAKFKNSPNCCVCVKGNILDLGVLFKDLFESSERIMVVADASIKALRATKTEQQKTTTTTKEKKVRGKNEKK